MDENAALRSKLAKQTVDSIGGPGSGGGGRRGAKQRAGGSSHSGDKGGGFYDDDASGSSSSVLAFAANAYDYEKYLPAPLLALDRRRRGLVPALFIAFLVCLIFVIAVLRAALSARGEHRGLCFLAKLGVNIGAGERVSDGSVAHACQCACRPLQCPHGSCGASTARSPNTIVGPCLTPTTCASKPDDRLWLCPHKPIMTRICHLCPLADDARGARACVRLTTIPLLARLRQRRQRR